MKKNATTPKGRILIWLLIAALGTGFALGTGIVPMKSTGARPESSPAALLESQAQSNPTDPEPWIELGNYYFDTDQYEKSIQSYEKALAITPDNPNVITDMGVMYRRSGNPIRAVDLFDRAIAADPTHEQSRMNKGVVLLNDLKDMPGAVAAWEGLLEINPFFMVGNDFSLEELVKKYKSQMP
ncbi:MAG: tetratricopeptide repeat protein [Desulfobacterales bacterium]|nr:tetratricopeptide repeat protein [Desulfobacterales bacterium]